MKHTDELPRIGCSHEYLDNFLKENGFNREDGTILGRIGDAVRQAKSGEDNFRQAKASAIKEFVGVLIGASEAGMVDLSKLTPSNLEAIGKEHAADILAGRF